jgi:Zn-dependent peptidase ImmA (M78 family)
MAIVNNHIEIEAQRLLDVHTMNEIPVPVEEIAKRIGVNVLAFDLGSDVSGMLHIKHDSASIGYNPNESKVRQRFTIAHELGHFILHREDKDKIFVDNENYFQIKFRLATTADYQQQQEQEANAFAAALLMPKTLVQKEIKNYSGFDLSDNSSIVELAKKFEVSIPAMSYRVLNLAESGLLR